MHTTLLSAVGRASGWNFDLLATTDETIEVGWTLGEALLFWSMVIAVVSVIAVWVIRTLTADLDPMAEWQRRQDITRRWQDEKDCRDHHPAGKGDRPRNR